MDNRDDRDDPNAAIFHEAETKALKRREKDYEAGYDLERSVLAEKQRLKYIKQEIKHKKQLAAQAGPARTPRPPPPVVKQPRRKFTPSDFGMPSDEQPDNNDKVFKTQNKRLTKGIEEQEANDSVKREINELKELGYWNQFTYKPDD